MTTPSPFYAPCSGARADAEPDAVTELAHRCARLPLALRIAAELAASRPTTPLTCLAGELADPQCLLDRLGAGGDPCTAISAVFSWSYRRLPADTASVFRQLGRHPDLAVTAVATMISTTTARARGLLDQLVRAHLAQETSPGRFRMHNLLRTYATELALAGATGREPSDSGAARVSGQHRSAPHALKHFAPPYV